MRTKMILLFILSVLMLGGCGKKEAYAEVPPQAVPEPGKQSAPGLLPEDTSAAEEAVAGGRLLAQAAGTDTALYYLDKTDEAYTGIVLKNGEVLSTYDWGSLPVSMEAGVEYLGENGFLQVWFSYPEEAGGQIHLLDAGTGAEIPFVAPEKLAKEYGLETLTSGEQPFAYSSASRFRREGNQFVCWMTVSDSQNEYLGKMEFSYEFDGTGLVSCGVNWLGREV